MVVQLVVPATRVSDSEVVGATASMSGATVLEARAVASPTVRVEAEPNPPRIPELEVVLPGETVSRLEPEGGDLGADLLLGPLAQPDGQDDRGDADHDAEHGERRAQPVGDHRLEPGAEGLERGSSDALRSAAGSAGDSKIWPSRIRMVRPAERGHVGVVGDEHDGAAAAVELAQQVQHVACGDRVEVAGGLVGQDQCRDR